MDLIFYLLGSCYVIVSLSGVFFLSYISQDSYMWISQKLIASVAVSQVVSSVLGLPLVGLIRAVMDIAYGSYCFGAKRAVAKVVVYSAPLEPPLSPPGLQPRPRFFLCMY